MSRKQFRGKPPATPREKSLREAISSYPGSGVDAGLEYVLLKNRIEIWSGEQVLRALPLDTVRRVRLGFDPTARQSFLNCTVHAGEHDLVFTYQRWRFNPDGKVWDYDTGVQYAHFVNSLLRTLASYPHIRFRIGSGLNFLLFAVFGPVFVGVGVLGIMFREIRLAMAGLEIAVGVIGGMVAFWPRRFDPRNPPKHALPF
ncbi:MAG TPA: hypothetical protein VFS20_14335 [Longimicrobium sp.]|nr:hypothetical protein [Longimicrobium sp.]